MSDVRMIFERDLELIASNSEAISNAMELASALLIELAVNNKECRPAYVTQASVDSLLILAASAASAINRATAIDI